MKIKTHSEKETEETGYLLAGKLHGGEVLAFFGNLGAGKTAFIRGIARGLGYHGEVTSPTYTIMHEYKTGIFNVCHFDMYRINDLDSLISTGFFDCIEKSDTITVIEWSENISFALTEGFIKITISYGDCENERFISID